MIIIKNQNIFKKNMKRISNLIIKHQELCILFGIMKKQGNLQ